MSDEPIELNDNTVTDDDLATPASFAREDADARPRPARAAGGRFGPGQSGNPRGRPRKAPEAFHAMTARVLNETVTLTLQGQRVEMTCAEGMFRAMCHAAMKDPRLGKEVFRYAAAREAGVDPGVTEASLAQSEAAFENYRVRMRRQILAELSALSAASSGVGDNDNPGAAVEPEDAS